MFESLKFLWNYAWKVDKLYLLCLILFQFTNSVAPILLMIFPKVLLDQLMGQNEIIKLFEIVIFFSLGIFSGQLLSSILQNSAFYRRGIILERFQHDLCDHLSKVDFENLEDPKFLDLKQNAEKFLYANGQGFSFVLDRSMNIIGKIIIFATVIGIIATLNVWVLIGFLILSGINSLAQMKFKKQYANLEIEKNPKERRLAYLTNIFPDPEFEKEIRVNGGRELLLLRLEQCTHKLWKFYKKQMQLMNGSKAILYATDFLQRVTSYLYMIYEVSIGLISIANFTMYINAISTFTSSMNEVIDSINDIRQYSIYFESVEKYLNLPTRIYTGSANKTVPETISTIEFQNVSFKYPRAKKYALKDISCKFSGSQRISIVGENGAGKSTFIKLICRFYEPTAGKILLNGIDIQEYSYPEYIKKISAIFQDYQLFSLPVSENIALNNHPDERMEKRIIQKLRFDGVISTLWNGLQTYIHKDFDLKGYEPSGGIGQKIAIARAIYKDAPIIILDEPTASLDPRAEYEIYQSFERIVQGKLSFYISHRLSSSKFCDLILVFKDGRIIESGTHEELMRAQSVYEELYSMQSKYYREA